MDGGDQDGRGWGSTVDFENKSDPCAHTSQPIGYKLTCHIGQKVSQSLFFYLKNRKRTLCVHFKWVRRMGCFI